MKKHNNRKLFDSKIINFKDNAINALSDIVLFLDQRKHLLVVTIHRVDCKNSITTRILKNHFEFLRQKYHLIFPSQINLKPTKKRIAIITIDDCHHDTFDVVFPLAKQLDIPLTIFVPTDFFFRNKWLWVDRARFGLQQIPPTDPVFLRHQDKGHHNSLSHDQFIARLKTYNPTFRESLLGKIFRDARVTIPKEPTADYCPVPLANMKKMLATGLIELGSHTVSHNILTSLSFKEMQIEIVESKNEIESFCRKKVVSFCYPNGLPGDYSTQTQHALLKAGYNKIFTSITGVNYFSNLDLLNLKRVHIHKRLAVFKKMVTSLRKN